METDYPGPEVPKEYREVIEYQIRVCGWRYDKSGKGHPVLYPPDRSHPPVRVATTPSRSPRAFKNWVAEIRRKGGLWPPRG